MVRYMQTRTGMRYFAIIFCIVCLALTAGAFAGCGVDPNPYDDNPGTLPNGYYPPAADFSGGPVQGYAPLEVTFTDKSTNVPRSWTWNFGDGQSSNEPNPVHIYQSPGTYTISLTAGNGYGGNSIIKANYVIVSPASSTPVVDFSADITSGNAPLKVEFTDLSSGGLIISRAWTFGTDSGPVPEITTDRKITHTFSGPGYYNVSLTVTAENNESASLEKPSYIRVRLPPPGQGTITLRPGWNLVSTPLPLQEQDRTAGRVFAGIDMDSRSMFSYDAGSGQYVPLNLHSIIFPLEGIWVYSKDEVPLTFNYQVTRPVTISMHMPSGWNLIGYPSTEPGNAREGFSSINTIWSTILCFDPVTQQYSSTIFNEGAGEGNGDQMNPLQGYWIFMPEEGDLMVLIE